MRYYKETLEDGSIRYCETTLKRTESNFEEISQEEYLAEVAKLWEDSSDSQVSEEPTDGLSYEELLERNSELEAENAALLFQVLTGEVFTDV